MYFFLAPWPVCATFLDFVTVTVCEGHQMWGPSLCTSLPLAHCSPQPSSSFNRSLKFKFRSKLTRITGTLQQDTCAFTIISRSVLLGMRNVSDKSCKENQNTHFMCSNFFFFLKIVPLWDNVEKYIRTALATDNNMAHVHCMQDTKSTDTPSQYKMFIAFPPPQCLHERTSMLRYT
jgi:hypothetical protein